MFGACFFVGDVGGADFSCYCSEVAVVNSALAVALYGADQLAPIDNVAFGGFPLLQEIFYIIAASDKSLTHTKWLKMLIRLSLLVGEFETDM